MQLASQFKLLTEEDWQRDWWLLLVLKMAVALILPLFADEAYYWFWSHHLKLSYFDHPPFIAWLFYLGQPIEDFLSASRLPTVLMGSLTIWIWCGHLAAQFSSSQKRILLWILSLHTLVGLGTLVANPDVPFLFFWSLSLLFFAKSLELPESHKWPTYLGITLGLGFCSKYLIALFVPAAAFYLLASGTWRRLRIHQIALPTLFGALFSLPVLIWNFQNDWISIGFQIEHGLGRSWKPSWTTDFILGTSFLLFWPFVFLYVKEHLYKKWRELHSVFFVSLLLFFIYTTFKGDTELNWPLMIYPSFFFLIVQYVPIRKTYFSYLLFFGALSLVLLATPIFSLPVKLHPRLVEGVVYKNVYESVKKYHPLYTSTYQTASYFSYLGQKEHNSLEKKDYFKLRYSSRKDEFDFLPDSEPTEDSFYFLKEKYQIVPEQYKERYLFEKLIDLEHNFEIYEAKRLK